MIGLKSLMKLNGVKVSVRGFDEASILIGKLSLNEHVSLFCTIIILWDAKRSSGLLNMCSLSQSPILWDWGWMSCEATAGKNALGMCALSSNNICCDLLCAPPSISKDQLPLAKPHIPSSQENEQHFQTPYAAQIASDRRHTTSRAVRSPTVLHWTRSMSLV